jgi:hypothetical protein
MGFAVGDQVWHLANGQDRHATVIALPEGSMTRVRWNNNHHVFDAATQNLRAVQTLRWRDVQAGDTVEFEVQGDTLTIEAQGFGTQVTVLGWKTTEVDSIWDLRGIRKRNPDMPSKIGARIHYRGAEWLLLYPHMSNPRLSDYSKIWVKVDEAGFGWCDHMDPDKEVFEVLSNG